MPKCRAHTPREGSIRACMIRDGSRSLPDMVHPILHFTALHRRNHHSAAAKGGEASSPFPPKGEFCAFICPGKMENKNMESGRADV